MREKLAERFEAHTALETEGIEGCRQQTREPTSAVLGFPQPRLRIAGSAFDGLFQTMHTALGNPRLTGQLSYTLVGVITKTLENPQAFGPKSHVGLFSEGCLNSWWNSVPQRTRPTPNCPALSGYPAPVGDHGA